MARRARVEVFAADEIAVVHVMNRTVRRCFLLGDDPVSGKNFDHRKRWLDEQLIHQARHFGIDLLCQAILRNHFHLARASPATQSEVARPSVQTKLSSGSAKGAARRFGLLHKPIQQKSPLIRV